MPNNQIMLSSEILITKDDQRLRSIGYCSIKDYEFEYFKGMIEFDFNAS